MGIEDLNYQSDQQTNRNLLAADPIKHSIPKLDPAPIDPPRILGRYSPGHILAIIIGGIALAEVFAMLIVYFFRDLPYYQQVVLDALIMAVIIFPLLYYLSFKPLLAHIQQRYQSESIIQIRMRLMQFANTHTLDDLLQFTLDEIETSTGSKVGFFHFLEADQKTLWLQAWSTNTLQNMCTAEGKDTHYNVDQAGVWADAVRQRQPVIHNNYAALPNRKGIPEGHALVTRELVVPIMRADKVLGIVGVGNKPQDYTARDVEVVSSIADFAWDTVEHMRAENALRQSEEKFRTLLDWTYDWEKWVDSQGNIVYTSPSCERITGYTREELIDDPGLLIRILHPEDRQRYEEHLKSIHEVSADPGTIEYRIVARDGKEHWIEHICRPLLGPGDRYLGRRVSDRDITERKQAEQKIIQQKQIELSLIQTIQTIQTDIARDLHDTLGQNISFLRMNLEHLSKSQPDDSSTVKIQFQNMTNVANESYDLIRAMLAALQAGNLTDPLSLFTRYAEQVAERASFQSLVSSRGRPRQLTPHQTRQLFFIFREALSNIEKYADAKRVSCEFLWEENALKLIITDDGRGFDPDAIRNNDRYGLKFMRERAELLRGSFSIQSSPGRGALATVCVPYEYPIFPQSQ